jgi:hypothetical protein
MRYRVTSGTLTVQARSRLHDTTTVWNKLSGTIVADADTLATAGATADFQVEMDVFDAGDLLKNRKLRNDFALARHPIARFKLGALRAVVRTGDSFSATAEGTLDWRGRQLVLVMQGRGTLTAMGLEASAKFELDIRTLGLTAPRFLMFKVEDEVTVEVRFRAAVAA